jgi:hypothetical protein
MAEAWSLTDEEQMKLLGLGSRSTLLSRRSGRVARIGRDELERISYLLGIFKALNVLLPGPRADAWLRARNKSPLLAGALSIVCWQATWATSTWFVGT